MKVILLQDVARIGRKGSIVEVPDGFAQNKLIPKKMAEPATPINLKKAEKTQATAVAQQGAAIEKFEQAAASLREKLVSIKVQANEQGHLFKAVHEEDIAAAAASVGIFVDAAMIRIPVQIKSLGKHDVQLALKNKQSTFTVEVISN